ncbi:MAG: sigma-54-dependent transcriptional regulator [Granulosicoccaceae bacterium]
MNNLEKILLVDDDPHVLASTAQTLELAGFDVVAHEQPAEALRLIDRSWPGVVITDLRMPKIDGIELMQKIQRVDEDLPLILISGHADIADAVQALRKGAYDFLEKPFHAGRLCDCTRRALAHRQLVLENRRLSTALSEQADSTWIGSSLAAQRLREQISVAARNSEPLTLIGERGCGKTLAAITLHKNRSLSGHLEIIDCNILDSSTDWRNTINNCKSGTLILKHIERADYDALLELNELLRSDSALSIQLIATARRFPALGDKSAKGVPSWLFYELTRKTIEVPDLASRAEDIPVLFKHFLQKASRILQRPVPMVRSAYLAELMTRDWPDNTRELKGICDSWLAEHDERHNEISKMPSESDEPQLSLPERVSLFEKKIIESELEGQQGDIKKTYTALGIARKTLYDKLEKYVIRREDFLATNHRDTKNSGD